MTETTPEYCDECQAAVRVERDTNDALYAVCACGWKDPRPLRTGVGFPEDWQ